MATTRAVFFRSAVSITFLLRSIFLSVCKKQTKKKKEKESAFSFLHSFSLIGNKKQVALLVCFCFFSKAVI